MTYLFIFGASEQVCFWISYLLFPSLYKKYIPNGELEGTVSVFTNKCTIKRWLGFLNKWLCYKDNFTNQKHTVAHFELAKLVTANDRIND